MLESELMKLQQLTLSLPSSTVAVRVRVRNPQNLTAERIESRVFRFTNGLFDCGFDLDRCLELAAAPETQTIVSDVTVYWSGRAACDVLDHGSRSVHNEHQDGKAPLRGSSPLKGVLIQLATGPHQELLDLTRAHHRAYAERHGLDYWCIEGNPAEPKRPGWGKIPLVLSALQMGFERIVWMDADAVVVNPTVNLASVIESGIGIVQHPNPVHWNSGVMVVCRSEQTRRFFEAVNREPENESAWMEQLPINQLAERSEYAGLFKSLDPSFNSTPGAVMSPAPVVLAAHGLPHSTRKALIAQWLHDLQADGLTTVDDRPLRTRADFGEFLNRRGLLGEAAEIGVLRGEFSKVLLDRWRGTTLHLVDPWRHLDGYHDISNLDDSEHEKCLNMVNQNLATHRGRYRLHRKLSEEAVDSFVDGSLDFVYIDANHEYTAVLHDVQEWFAKVRPGGVLAGHDYLDGHLPEGDFGVKSAVSHFASEVGVCAQTTSERAWPSWYIIKPNARS
jgi:hypothetical protein